MTLIITEYLVWKKNQPEVYKDMYEDHWLETKGKGYFIKNLSTGAWYKGQPLII